MSVMQSQPLPVARPTHGFRPISRQASVQTREHPADRQSRSQLDSVPLSQLLLSKDFGSSQTPRQEVEEEHVDDDEIEGEGHFVDNEDQNFTDVFTLDENQLREEGFELNDRKQRVEFEEEPPPRFGTKHKTPTKRWKADETKKFYDVLAMCGADFSMISKFFPDRSRRMIVNKFRCEEKKKNNDLFLDALNNPKPLDLGMFAEIVGVEETALVDDFAKNRERVLKGLPLTPGTLPIHESESDVSGDDQFEDVDDENDEEKSVPAGDTATTGSEIIGEPTLIESASEVDGEDGF